MEINYDLIFGYDKSQHLFTYISVALFCGILLILICDDQHKLKRRVSFVWLTLVFIGIVEEYRQLLLPHRSAELLDALYNAVGASIGLAIPMLLLTLFRRHTQFPLKQIAIYFILLTPWFLGLLYFNEEPFITFNEPIKERLRGLVALLPFP